MGKKQVGNQDDWVSSYSGTVKRCATCKHEEANRVIDEILDSMARLRRPGVSQAAIYRRVQELVPTYDCHVTAFYQHLKRCKKDAWERATHG